jgi:hypothetical protein
MSAKPLPNLEPTAPRPASLIILAGLRFVAGLWELFTGGLLLAGSGWFGFLATQAAEEWLFQLGALTALTVGGLGLAQFLFGLLDFFIAWGVWSKQGWAWWTLLFDVLIGSACPLAAALTGNPLPVLAVLLNGLTMAILFSPEVLQAMRIRL